MKKKLILIFLFFCFCGHPKPVKMPESNPIYHEFTKEDIQSMLQSNNWQMRSNAVLYIQHKKWYEFSPNLLELLKNDPSAPVRQIAALTLSEFQYKPALPLMISILKNPQLNSKEIVDVSFLIDAISNYCDFYGLKETISLLTKEELILGLHIVKALEKCSDSFHNQQKSELGKIILNYAINNNDLDKHRTFAMALGRIRYKNAESYLIKLIESDEPPNTKAAAILSLGKIKSTKVIPYLIQFLKTYPDKLGENSFIALKEIKDPSITNAIFPFFETETKEIQLLVVDILIEISDHSIPDRAYNQLKQKNPHNIGTLSLLLGKLKYELARKDIEELLLNPQNPDREIIAQSLGWMQNKSAIPTLIQVLQEKDGEGRYGAAWSLGILEAMEAVPYLIKAMQSQDNKLAILSIEALGHIKSSDALPILEKLVKNPSKQIYALNTIGEISDPKATEILKKYAKQKGEISHIAIDVLSKRSEPEIIDILINILRETNTEDIKAKILYGALQRKTKKDYISKNQWLQWYEIEYQKK